MIAFGFLLFRVNAVYERLAGRAAGPATARVAGRRLTDERPSFRRARAGRSLLDVSMAVSVVAALMLLFVWFLFLPS